MLNVAVHILVSELLNLYFYLCFFPAYLICFYPSFSLLSSLYLSLQASFLTSVHFPTHLTTWVYKTLPFHSVFFFWFHSHLKLPSLLTPFVCVYLIHYSSSCIFFISSSYPEGFLYQSLQKYMVLCCHHAAYPWTSSFFLNVFSIFSEELCHTVTLQRTIFHFPPFSRSTFLPV